MTTTSFLELFLKKFKPTFIKANAVFSFLNIIYEKDSTKPLKWRIIIWGKTSSISQQGKQWFARAFKIITHASIVTPYALVQVLFTISF